MSTLVLFIVASAPIPSSFSDILLGSNNISPEIDGTEGKKNGAFSGFFGGSIGLLRAFKLKLMVQKSEDRLEVGQS